MDGYELKPVFRSYTKFNRSVADHALQFILSRANIKHISWGTTKLDGVEFPKLIRTRVPEHIHKAYVDAIPEKTSRLSVSSFLKVVNVVTHSDSKVRFLELHQYVLTSFRSEEDCC